MQVHLLTNHVAEISLPTFWGTRRPAFFMRGIKPAWEGFFPYLAAAIATGVEPDARWHKVRNQRGAAVSLYFHAASPTCFVFSVNGTPTAPFFLRLPRATGGKIVKVTQGEDWETPVVPLALQHYKGVVYPLPSRCFVQLSRLIRSSVQRVLMVTTMPKVFNPPRLRSTDSSSAGRTNLLKVVLREAAGGWQTLYRTYSMAGLVRSSVYGWTTWLENQKQDFPPTVVLVNARKVSEQWEVRPDVVWWRPEHAWFSQKTERQMIALDKKVNLAGF